MNSRHESDHYTLFRVCQFCEKWAIASAFYGHNSGAHCDIIEANTFNKGGRSMLRSLLTETLHCAIDERVLILNSASDPCVPHLAQQLSAGELLLAEDSIAACERAKSEVRGLGKFGVNLRQVAFHEYILREAPATMDVAVMNILYQPNNAWMHYAVRLAAYALKSG